MPASRGSKSKRERFSGWGIGEQRRREERKRKEEKKRGGKRRERDVADYLGFFFREIFSFLFESQIEIKGNFVILKKLDIMWGSCDSIPLTEMDGRGTFDTLR